MKSIIANEELLYNDKIIIIIKNMFSKPPQENPLFKFQLNDLFDMAEGQRRELYEMISRELVTGEIAGLEHRIAEDMEEARKQIAELQQELAEMTDDTLSLQQDAQKNRLERLQEWLNLIETLPIELCKSKGVQEEHRITLSDNSDYVFSAGPQVLPDEFFLIEYASTGEFLTLPTVTLDVGAEERVEVIHYDAKQHLATFRLTHQSGLNYRVAIKGEANILFTSTVPLEENHFRQQDPRLLSRIFTGFDALTSLAHRFGMSEEQTPNPLFPLKLTWQDHPYGNVMLTPQHHDFIFRRHCDVDCGQHGGTLRLNVPEESLILFSKAEPGVFSLIVHLESGSISINVKNFHFGEKSPHASMNTLSIRGGEIDPASFKALTPFAALDRDSQWIFLAQRLYLNEKSLFQIGQDLDYDWMSALAETTPEELFK